MPTRPSPPSPPDDQLPEELAACEQDASAAADDKPLRADQWMVAHGLVPSRARAQAEIKAGTVDLNGTPVRRPGSLVPTGASLVWRDPANPYVSRGGLKLAHALETFSLETAGRTALDLGASTGGFTDVLLRAGAARVFAVDVGHGQLHPSLAKDPRVTSLERVNARDLTAEHLSGIRPEIIVSDVSFISLTLALPPALALAADGAWLVALIKPQFEAGKGAVGKGGVLRDPEARAAIRDRLTAWIGDQPGWQVIGTAQSPIAGPNGNIEFLAAARKGSGGAR